MLLCPRCHTEQVPEIAHCTTCELRFKLPHGRKNTGAFIVASILLLTLTTGVGVVLGLRRYVDNARSVEARSGLLQIGHLAALAYGRDGYVCPSGTGRIPMDAEAIRGHYYQASVHEWHDDPGFSCLGYAPTNPQYYQYEYRSTETGFTARARGDHDGNGKLSLLELRGHVENGTLVLEPLHAQDIAE